MHSLGSSLFEATWTFFPCLSTLSFCNGHAFSLTGSQSTLFSSISMMTMSAKKGYALPSLVTHSLRFKTPYSVLYSKSNSMRRLSCSYMMDSLKA